MEFPSRWISVSRVETQKKFFSINGKMKKASLVAVISRQYKLVRGNKSHIIIYLLEKKKKKKKKKKPCHHYCQKHRTFNRTAPM